MEGSGVGSAGCVVHVDVHGESCVVQVATESGCLVCRRLWNEQRCYAFI